MLNFIFGVVVGVVLAGLGILTLPKLKALWVLLKAKFTKQPVAVKVTTPPVTAPATTPTP